MDKYRSGDWYVYCDICGRKLKASESVRLDTYTGRGGLIVCKQDADRIDYGTVPYKIPTEQNIPWARINHTDTTNSSPIVNMEDMALEYYLTSSQDDFILTPSQNTSELFVVTIPI